MSLSDFGGNVVVLGFWSSLVDKSVNILPVLQGVHEEYGGKSFSVIGINTFEETTSDARKMLDRHNITFVNLFDDAGKVSDQYEA